MNPKMNDASIKNVWPTESSRLLLLLLEFTLYWMSPIKYDSLWLLQANTFCRFTLRWTLVLTLLTMTIRLNLLILQLTAGENLFWLWRLWKLKTFDFLYFVRWIVRYITIIDAFCNYLPFWVCFKKWIQPFNGNLNFIRLKTNFQFHDSNSCQSPNSIVTLHCKPNFA